MLQLPDALVLGGGGTLGEAWMMGVLGGIEDATGLDLRQCEYFVGTSAGSIVAAHLVAGRSPRRPKPLPASAAPGGAVMRGTLLRRLPRPHQTLDRLEEHISSLGARFDGRLRLGLWQRAGASGRAPRGQVRGDD